MATQKRLWIDCQLSTIQRLWSCAKCHQPRIAPDDMGALLDTIIQVQCGWKVDCPHRLGEWSMILKARQSAATIVT